MSCLKLCRNLRISFAKLQKNMHFFHFNTIKKSQKQIYHLLFFIYQFIIVSLRLIRNMPL